jgi:hypothetical protein
MQIDLLFEVRGAGGCAVDISLCRLMCCLVCGWLSGRSFPKSRSEEQEQPNDCRSGTNLVNIYEPINKSSSLLYYIWVHFTCSVFLLRIFWEFSVTIPINN